MKDYSNNLDKKLLNKLIPFIQETSKIITDFSINRTKRDKALLYLLNKFEEDIKREMNEWVFDNVFIVDRTRYSKPPFMSFESNKIATFTLCLN